MDPRLVAALRSLDRGGRYADLWRALAPIATRLGLRRPGYHAVRRETIALRQARERRRAVLEPALSELAKGMPPPTLRHATHASEAP
jgi:hypothetical protein